MDSGRKNRVCVLGAGVIGLSTAVRILEDQPDTPPGQVEVTVVADRFSPHTTSDGSGGFWEPYNLGDTPQQSIRQWGDATWEHLHQLATCPDTAAAVGAQFVSGYTLCDTDTVQDPSFKDRVLGYRYLTAQELRLFPFARWGYFHTTLQINVKSYLPWLMTRFKSLGGRTEVKTVHNLSEVAEEYDVVVNSCGPRAGALVSDPHTLPIRGQTRRIRAPWVKHFYICDSSDGNICYALPLGDIVVVGGTAQRGNAKEEVDAADSEEMWSRATSLFPILKGGEKVSEWAGLRPGRTSVRLETEIVKTKTNSLPVIHNYGHGGAGVTLHWGCAAEAAHLVRHALLHPAPHSRL
ncbi:D-aspartate oxidase-like [Littorina saxatilis]|uniref:FAD dependent oxidoreductase domain-containing protein n=1 Tax=Littorina saxatilis TaxID=31220 RepID=A0AAN9B8U2_9CAEN